MQACSPRSHTGVLAAPRWLPRAGLNSHDVLATRRTRRQFLRYVSRNPLAPPDSPNVRPRRAGRIALGLGLAGTAIYVADDTLNAKALQRTARAFGYGLLTIVDFKLHFTPNKADEIDALHQRVAQRLAYVCNTNAGLFIKLGQSIGIQAAILPKPYREAFASIFDAAPQISFEEVRKVFRKEFGKDVDEVFESFERRAIASASIAQVHRAKLNGRDVAVKVQKPDIMKQMEWDLFSYRTLLWTYEKIFQIPCYFIATYVTQQMRREVSFRHEAENAEKTARYLEKEPTLQDKVIVPKVIWDYTSERVMTAEMIPNACRITEKEKIEKMGLSPKTAMGLITNTYAAMLFKWGHMRAYLRNLQCQVQTPLQIAICILEMFVLVRNHPNHANRTQVVLIDHGLYIELPDKFRKSYATFWRALMMMDTETIEKIARGWGIGAPGYVMTRVRPEERPANTDFFATATLMRPFKVKPKTQGDPGQTDEKAHSSYQTQMGFKERLQSMLENEKLIPQELIFVARTMRMVQANNQSLGSPVNRINILAHWAALGYKDAMSTSNRSPAEVGLAIWLRDRYKIAVFRMTLILIDIGFYVTKIRQWAYTRLTGRDQGGFEEMLQKQISDLAHDEFGVELDDTAFSG